MAFQRPGVYVQETLNPVQPVVGPNSDSVGAFIGANDRGPTTPTLVTSWSDYVTKYGSWNIAASNSLPIAVYLFFSNGGSRCYVKRVTAGSATKASRTFTDRAGTPVNTLKLTAVNEGAWANTTSSATGINVSVSNSATAGYVDVTVFFGGTSDAYIVEKFTDVTMVSTDARYAVTVINSTSNYVTAEDLGSVSTGITKNPSVVANQTLTGGANGTAVESVTDFSAFDTVLQSLILNVPGLTGAATTNAAISYAEGRGDVFVVVDGINDTVANQLTLAGSYTASSHAAVYYPQVTISDPTISLGGSSSATKTVGAGGAVIGLYSATDTSRGVFKAPAGLSARLAGVVSVPTLTNANLDDLNSSSSPVNAIKYVPGSGIVVMGARTLKSTYIDKYVPVRRTLIYLRKALTDLTQFAIFEPNDPALWRRLNSACSSFLTQFWAQGGLRGTIPSEAFFVKVDTDNNPQYLIDNGEVHIEVGVALQRPAEFVVIKIGQFDGGTTVTVA